MSISGSLTLLHALRLSPDQPASLALVGSGGKTSAMAHLALHLSRAGGCVFLTTSTHLGAWQTGVANRHVVIGPGVPIPDFKASAGEIILFTGPEERKGILSGLSPADLAALRALAKRQGAWLLVEADGSRQRPLKAPAEHEPNLPPWVDHVLVVAGLSGLGQPLVEDGPAVHRPGLFARLCDRELTAPAHTICPEDLVRVLSHPFGGLKHIPASARRWVLLNQADTGTRQMAALEVSDELLHHYDGVIIADLQAGLHQDDVHFACQRTAGVILAAGASTRLGQPKTLLPWRGKPLVRHSAERALAAGLSPLLVVGAADTEGQFDPALREALHGLPVQFVPNPDYRAGQSASLRAGLHAARAACSPRDLGAIVFLLADQPWATSELILALRAQHRKSLAPVIAPFVGERRSNPVLFDQVTFADLAALSGDTGGRAIFQTYPPVPFPWDDPRLLIDIDTPEDYRRLLEMDDNE